MICQAWVFFLPRRFLMTNAMLKALRTDGWSAGVGGRNTTRYNDEVSSIRADVVPFARAAVKHRGPFRCTVELLFIGHHHFDPDAWHLPGKAIVDGLVDAGVFGSDRREMGVVFGYVAQSPLESRALFDAAGFSSQDFQPGVIVRVAEVPEVVDVVTPLVAERG